jgi:hypothetical protein
MSHVGAERNAEPQGHVVSDNEALSLNAPPPMIGRTAMLARIARCLRRLAIANMAALF